MNSRNSVTHSCIVSFASLAILHVPRLYMLSSILSELSSRIPIAPEWSFCSSSCGLSKCLSIEALMFFFLLCYFFSRGGSSVFFIIRPMFAIGKYRSGSFIASWMCVVSIACGSIVYWYDIDFISSLPWSIISLPWFETWLEEDVLLTYWLISFPSGWCMFILSSCGWKYIA